MAGKIEIPENLKSDLPPSKWGKVLGATPVIMTVIATMLAGLASSEMTQAQYERSLAAQLQSKAGDQWGYAAAKKTRGALARNSLDVLAGTADLRTLSPAFFPEGDAAITAAFTKNELPAVERPKFSAEIQAALDAVAMSQPETNVSALMTKVQKQDLVSALESAQAAAVAFDNAAKPITKFSDAQGEKLLAAGDKAAYANFAAARLRYTAARYDTEASLNQSVAGIYELQVREENILAEKHHVRSNRFFMGMLAAQGAVIISTFAIAARKKNFLWAIAALAGCVAVAFSLYVYLYI